ncbi:MAG: hypothetical protein FWG57_04590 [Endomicrobia bacterium]|nr:hypothetical protein [Endomicrobiia bacterium]
MATKVSKKKVTAAVCGNAEAAEVKEIKKKVVAKKTTAKKKAAAPKKTVKAEAPKKEKAKAKKVNGNYPDAYLVIDYPVESETICGDHYAVKVGASTDGYVEISFDNGEWQPCRFGGGYWWFDWSYFNKGDHSIAVRLLDPSGNVIVETPSRKCEIC